jgi:hypothetical protein
VDSLGFQMRLNRSQEGDLFADHRHHEDGRRRRRREREPGTREEEDTLELSGLESSAPDPEPEGDPPRLPQHLPNVALAGDPAAQVASYWMKLIEESDV